LLLGGVLILLLGSGAFQPSQEPGQPTREQTELPHPEQQALQANSEGIAQPEEVDLMTAVQSFQRALLLRQEQIERAARQADGGSW
jgi:hypothetical protein